MSDVSEDTPPSEDTRNTAQKSRDQTNRFLAICLIVVGILVAGSLAYYGYASSQLNKVGRQGISTTLTNRQTGKTNLSIECAIFTSLKPAIHLEACIGLPPIKLSNGQVLVVDGSK